MPLRSGRIHRGVSRIARAALWGGAVGAAVGCSTLVPQESAPRFTANLDNAAQLKERAISRANMGKLTEAVQLAEEWLSLSEKAHGPEDPRLIRGLEFLGQLHEALAQYAQAESVLRRVLLIQVKTLGKDDLNIARTLDNLGRLYRRQSNYEQAEPFYRRALAIRENALGPDHPEVAGSLNNLAGLYYDQKQCAQAEPLYRRTLAIYEKTLGPEHRSVAASLNNLATVYECQLRFGEAELLLQRALAVIERTLGPEHPNVAVGLNNLGSLYYRQGQYAAAEPLLRRALAIHENTLGPDHVQVALSLNSLAVLYLAQGQYAKAQPLLQRALKIHEKALGPDHPRVARSLYSLAVLYSKQEEYAKAEPLLRRALAIEQKALGPEHPDLAATLNGLAALYGAQGQYAQAEAFCRRALAIREKALGPNHPEVAESLNNLGELSKRQGHYDDAERLLRRALAIHEKALGPEHPDVARVLINLGVVRWAQGDVAGATSLLKDAADLEERILARIIGTGSEDRKRAYLGTRAHLASLVLTLHVTVARQNAEAGRLALSSVLRWKGRSLDAMADFLVAARGRLPPTRQPIFEEWIAARNRYAAFALQPRRGVASGARRDLATLTARIEDLETELGNSIAALGLRPDEITPERVRQAIPAEAALVEVLAIRPFDPRSGERPWGPRHYVAYVLFRDETTWVVDLGDAAVIDGEVAAFRAALRDPGRVDVLSLGRALDERLMRPIRPLLRDRRLVLLSPDGALNLVPFAALVDEHQQALANRFTFVYLTSGRDLLRFQTRSPSHEGVLVVAAPDFEDTQGRVEARPLSGELTSSSRRSVDFARRAFLPLPATADEARAIQALLPDATVLTGAGATEAALKRVHGPRILHLATHGFFLPDQPGTGPPRRDLEDLSLFTPDDDPGPENPLLRSGLALAGANHLQSGDDDGLLTALEIASMDLGGTRLVVLSACETGIGATPYGEGVYGLRRALVLAGAESQVMSLWPVDDDTTRDLMIAYYRQLGRGEGRAEALRLAQREIAASPRREHPFFWASFIPIGAWGPLE